MSPPLLSRHPPSATYRLQLNQGLTFGEAVDLVGYLEALGISDLYASPFLMARPGSLHGYDVTDPSSLNPEIGTEEDLGRLAGALREKKMGLVVDVIPNHLCIADSANRWWLDVLENGPSSPYARYFDIDWSPPKPDLVDKVLLPVLGHQYGDALEAQAIRVSFEEGALWARCGPFRFPLGPKTWIPVLQQAVAAAQSRLGPAHSHVLEFESILTALRHLPSRSETDVEKVRERQREKEIVKRRLGAVAQENNVVRGAIEDAIRDLNGAPGSPRSFDPLEALLADQAFRLSHWRVASDEINYRRFFDVNELAAIRVEEAEVFAAVHQRILDFRRRGWITGLRVDHVDGLWTPARYLRELHEAAGAPYLVVEKILLKGEELSAEWPVHGTTGYDFLNQVNGLFVDPTARALLLEGYRRFTGVDRPFADTLYECKKIVLQTAMSSELTVLARRLDRISEQHRSSRDFTLNSLQHALAEMIACFPAYRTYTEPGTRKVTGRDREQIRTALRAAKRRNPAIDGSIFDFIGNTLLLEAPVGLPDEDRAARRDWALRFQQLTAPVMAKGMEDTAFYRHFPLASLNEVGADPERFGVTPDEFHRWNLRRLEAWPASLSATSTHDTKRGEDTRLRINALSEIPQEWFSAVGRWREMNRVLRTAQEGIDAPSPNDEYLFYQVLVGTWPDDAPTCPPAFVERVEEYMIKAVREAKVHTSWINPEEEYESAVRRFVRGVLESQSGHPFREDFASFHRPLARASRLAGLSQVVLKVASPGVPDFYQGTELWDHSLVDPDNRRPVDFGLRRRLLESLGKETPESLMRSPEDGRIKMLVTRRCLMFRRSNRDLFERGSYVPLVPAGARSEHVCAFARVLDGRAAVAVAGRFFLRLGEAPDWAGTVLAPPPDAPDARYRDILTARELRPGPAGIPLGDLLAVLPVALLERVPKGTP